MSSKLDEWEKEARNYCDKSIAWIADEFPTTEAQERILTLIDLVRKKDAKFWGIIIDYPIDECPPDECGYANHTLKACQRALALTENLK